MAKTVPIRLQIPKSLAKRLQQAARDYGESRDSIVAHAIRDTVAQLEYRKLFLAWQKAERERQEQEDRVLARGKSRAWRLKRERLRKDEEEREKAKARLHFLLLEGLSSGPGRPADEVIAEMQKRLDKAKARKRVQSSQGRAKRKDRRSRK